SEVTTQSGSSRAVATSLLASGSRSVASRTTRTGERMPGRRQVSNGSSATPVPMPVSTASLRERIRWARVRPASPGTRAGRAWSGWAGGGRGELEGPVRRAARHPREVAGGRPPRLLGADADLDHDAGFGQAPMAGARDLRIGIDQRGHNARDAGSDDGVGA